jgi:hypothetical protein
MSKENVFTEAKQSVILKTKVVPVQAFVYKDFSDLENLIKFVGSRPLINGDMSIQFKKTIVPKNSVVMRNQYGEVISALTFDQANTLYEIAAQSEFKPEHVNKVIDKEVKKRTPKK